MTAPLVPPLYRWLVADAAVANLVGVRVYPAGEAEPEVKPPYVTWQQVSGLPENYTDDDPDTKAFRIQVNCWGKESGDAVHLAELVDRALRPHGQKQLDLRDERDPETGSFVFSMDWLFWLN